MNTRKNRAKRAKLSESDYVADFDETSISSSHNDQDGQEEARKSRIRDSNKEFARRMTILQSWSEHWRDYSTREGEAYPQQQAREMIKRLKKIACPIESCGKTFTSIGGLKYHYARCNLERSFTCLVCDPHAQLSTRGELLKHMILNHYEELPALVDDQREIANSYLSYENRIDKNKRDKRISADTEISYSGQRLVRSYGELLNRVFASEGFASRPFKDWQLLSDDWELVLHEFDRKRYYPPESESVRFKHSTGDEWSIVKTGESHAPETDKASSTSIIFFTGGINTASAWLPKPPHAMQSQPTPDLICISVNCCSMDHNQSYSESKEGENCIQFWTLTQVEGAKNGTQNLNSSLNLKAKMNISLSYILGHDYGTVFEMLWCPLGASWQPQVNIEDALARVGLLALACGDGRVRILSIPHTNSLLAKVPERKSVDALERTPIFRTKPIATLMPPGVGPSTDYQPTACKSICWDLEGNQRLLAAGYSNGTVALFDLANGSPILYTSTQNSHIYQPLKSWIAHGAPVTGIAISSSSNEKILIATGSNDRQLKIWNALDLNSCLTTDRAPITRILWDFRFRGVITATDTAFTSYNNRVSYRYPMVDGYHSVTVSAHRSTVWGLSNSVVTNAVATSDGAGEVFVIPQLISRSLHKRDRNLLSTHSLYTLLPRALDGTNKQSSVVDLLTFPESGDEVNKVSEAPASDGEENGLEADADFSAVERSIANKPSKFLLPFEHRPVETYSDFKNSFGLEFINYSFSVPTLDTKLPESCTRAGDTKNIYCDRPCDYPFSSVNSVTWSPNADTFPCLLSATQVGLCRLDRVQIVEQVYKGYVESIVVDRNLDNKDKQ